MPERDPSSTANAAGESGALKPGLRLDFLFRRDTLWNLVSLIPLGLGGIVMNLIILRLRGADSLGMFNQAYAIYIVLSQIGVGGLQYSTLKHVSYHQQDREACAQITLTSLYLVLGLSILMAAIMTAASGWVAGVLQSPGVAIGLARMAPGLVFFGLNKVLLMAVNGLNRMVAFAFLRAVRFVLLPISVAAIALSALPSDWLPLAFTVTEALLFLVSMAYVQRRLFSLRPRRMDAAWYRAHISFGLRGFMSGVLMELNTRIDVLLLGFFSTDLVVGIYTFAANIVEGFGQIPLVMGSMVNPALGGHFARGETQPIADLARSVRRSILPLMAVIGAVTLALYPWAYPLAAGDSNVRESWIVLAIMMAGMVVNSGWKPFAQILLQGGHPGRYTLFITALMVCNVALNLALIPRLGLYGAAITTACTYLLEACLIWWIARAIFRIKL
jgi:O-antigen/teichoic acid export membrane protein